MPASLSEQQRSAIDASVEAHLPGLVVVRRDLHAHPELSNAEHRTTEVVRARLAAAGLDPQALPRGTGLTCDVGVSDGGPSAVALRADLDALPVSDEKHVDYEGSKPVPMNSAE